MLHLFTPHLAAPLRLLGAAVLLALCLPASAALDYALGGFYRPPGPDTGDVRDFLPTVERNASHTGGANIFPGNDAILVNNFGVARQDGSFSSGVLANAQYPLGFGLSQTARAVGVSQMTGDVLQFQGVTGSTFVTFGYRFNSVVRPTAPDIVHRPYSGLWATLYSLQDGSDSLSPTLRKKVNYSYSLDSNGQPRVTLNGAPGQDPLSNFSYEGSFNMYLAPGYSRVLLQEIVARTEAKVNGLRGEGSFFGAVLNNSISLWIEGYGQEGISLAGSLSGHDYAFVPAPAVPEPAGAPLLLAGLVTLGAWLQRRRPQPQLQPRC